MYQTKRLSRDQMEYMSLRSGAQKLLFENAEKFAEYAFRGFDVARKAFIDIVQEEREYFALEFVEAEVGAFALVIKSNTCAADRQATAPAHYTCVFIHPELNDAYPYTLKAIKDGMSYVCDEWDRLESPATIQYVLYTENCTFERVSLDDVRKFFDSSCVDIVTREELLAG